MTVKEIVYKLSVCRITVTRSLPLSHFYIHFLARLLVISLARMVVISEIMGGFGLYHAWLCLLVFSSRFGVAFHQMAIIFLAPPTQFECPGVKTECCTNPKYDTSIFKRTIITEWNLICGNSWLKDLTQTAFQFGVLTGSLFFGITSDK